MKFYLFVLCGILFSLMGIKNICLAGDRIVAKHSMVDASPEIILLQIDSLTGNVDSATHAIHHENKKLIAAILAFPLPFGILGLHRIYLGTKPYMPYAYIGTLGGCLGIIPLIDFISILATKKEDLQRFENNPKVIMWIR